MDLLSLIVVLVVVGLVLYLINAYVPMDGKIKQILNIAVVIFIVIWFLKASGLLSSLRTITI